MSSRRRHHLVCFDHLRMRAHSLFFCYALVASNFGLRLARLLTAKWTSLLSNILAILALNEKMPGDDVKYQASSVHLFFQVNISKDA